MTPTQIFELIGQGESGSLEFKEEAVRPESLAREMVAFANTLGGVILIGVTDDGVVAGVDDPTEIEHRVINVARHNVTPALRPIIETVMLGQQS
ncbi:ATP-binding protein, partial [Arthrospira platensis SPKY1]|nr:ATP-binding protein [Arthrospira platensis SPKY1]